MSLRKEFQEYKKKQNRNQLILVAIVAISITGQLEHIPEQQRELLTTFASNCLLGYGIYNSKHYLTDKVEEDEA